MLLKEETYDEPIKRAPPSSPPPPAFPQPEHYRSYEAPTYPPPRSQNSLPHQCSADCATHKSPLPLRMPLSPRHLAKIEKMRHRIESRAQKLEMKILKKQEKVMRKVGGLGMGQWGCSQPSVPRTMPPMTPPMTTPSMARMGPPGPMMNPLPPSRHDRRHRRREERDMRRMDRLVERMQGLEVSRAFLDAAVGRRAQPTVSVSPSVAGSSSSMIPSDPPPAYTPRVPQKDQ